MSLQSWEELINTIIADATAVTGTSETIMVPDFTLPANYMYPGRILRARLSGLISNVVTTPGTITFRARWGGVSGTVLVASAAMAQNTVAQTNDQCDAEFLITCRSSGSSGSLFTSGRAIRGNNPTAGLVDLIPASGNAVVSALNLAAATALSFTAQFSVTGNSLTVNQYTLESMS